MTWFGATLRPLVERSDNPQISFQEPHTNLRENLLALHLNINKTLSIAKEIQTSLNILSHDISSRIQHFNNIQQANIFQNEHNNIT